MSADSASHIQQGALRAIFDAGPDQERLTPILQCVHVRCIPASAGQTERYRLVLSDIKNFVQGMIATQVNRHIYDGKLKRGCFVRLTDYTANQVKGKL
jgi:replication factor A1